VQDVDVACFTHHLLETLLLHLDDLASVLHDVELRVCFWCFLI
jgi:hypothetical protein